MKAIIVSPFSSSFHSVPHFSTTTFLFVFSFEMSYLSLFTYSNVTCPYPTDPSTFYCSTSANLPHPSICHAFIFPLLPLGNFLHLYLIHITHYFYQFYFGGLYLLVPISFHYIFFIHCKFIRIFPLLQKLIKCLIKRIDSL